MEMIKKFNNLIVTSAKNGYSDVHITGGEPLVFRKSGELNFDRTIRWSYQEVDNLAKELLNKQQLEILRKRLSVDFAISINYIRTRINVFNSIRGLSFAIRLLPGSVPSLDKLNLHPSLQSISELKEGLVLICGTTGSGKTTTIAAILDEINRNRSVHVITLEDPIEYRIKSKKSFIEQREIGTHIPSLEQGLVDVMRADPDVIMVGELRDPETIRLTLNAAESGHLVIGTLHASNTEDAIYRIINSVPAEAEEYIRYQLASVLSWIIVQKFIYIEKAGFRVPLLSILRGTQQIKGLVREKKLFQIENAIHTGKNEGMFTMDRYKNEYINLTEKFVNPALSFRPSEEAIHDAAHRSAIFDLDLYEYITPGSPYFKQEEKNTEERTADEKRLMNDHSPGTADNYDSQYVINESANLEDLIAQTDEISASKPKKR